MISIKLLFESSHFKFIEIFTLKFLHALYYMKFKIKSHIILMFKKYFLDNISCFIKNLDFKIVYSFLANVLPLSPCCGKLIFHVLITKSSQFNTQKLNKNIFFLWPTIFPFGILWRGSTIAPMHLFLWSTVSGTLRKEFYFTEMKDRADVDAPFPLNLIRGVVNPITKDRHWKNCKA